MQMHVHNRLMNSRRSTIASRHAIGSRTKERAEHGRDPLDQLRPPSRGGPRRAPAAGTARSSSIVSVGQDVDVVPVYHPSHEHLHQREAEVQVPALGELGQDGGESQKGRPKTPGARAPQDRHQVRCVAWRWENTSPRRSRTR
jgi:hypothetical protein